MLKLYKTIWNFRHTLNTLFVHFCKQTNLSILSKKKWYSYNLCMCGLRDEYMYAGVLIMLYTSIRSFVLQNKLTVIVVREHYKGKDSTNRSLFNFSSLHQRG